MAYASGRGRGPVEIIGHRGSPREHRENTLASFARAFAAGADAVELDVHATSDGSVVVHHDPATNSRPGDSGDVVVIAETTLARLRAIDVHGERIPTLEELLAIAPDRATVYVEVKASRIEDPVVAAIRSSDRRCAVHSFDHRVARRIREIAPDVPVGILQTSYPIDLLRPMHDVQARDLWQQWELIDAELIERVQRDGGRVIAWTVNDPAVGQRLDAWGIDGICTDVPALMRAQAVTWVST
ncbi:MAG TPA: glycerophosphodiester phosphodiesterase [Gemmatimonadaceae bacterium]|nr:glycerophosphodiester phosphodiesterase [Gemmatimonadaceae bacterium]